MALLVLRRLSFVQEGWALRYRSLKIRHFHDIW